MVHVEYSNQATSKLFCPNHWLCPLKAFIVKQLQEVLKKSLLTKHSSEVDQKTSETHICSMKSKNRNEGVKENSQYDSYDPRANTAD